MLAAKALTSLHICTDSPEPSSLTVPKYVLVKMAICVQFMSVNSEYSGESALATMALLCVVSMRKHDPSAL